MSESLIFLQQIINSANTTLDVLQANTNANVTAAYNQANTATSAAATALTVAESAYAEANAAPALISAAYNQANAALTVAESAYSEANGALQTTGGTMSGYIDFPSGALLTRVSPRGGYLNGNYLGGYAAGNTNPGGETAGTTGLIYTIGNGYTVTSNNLGQTYGIGYTNSNTASNTVPLGFSNPPIGHWGMYVAENGQTEIFLDSQTGTGWFTGDCHVLGNFYIDTISITSLISNAYNQANTGLSVAEAAYSTANAALTVAESAYSEANNALSSSSYTAAANGYFQMSNGLVFIWGQFAISGVGGQSSQLGGSTWTPFPNNFLQLFLQPVVPGASGQALPVAVNTITNKTAFTWNTGYGGQSMTGKLTYWAVGN